MSSRYFDQETATGTGKIELETATGGAGDPDDFLIEDATTTPISNTWTHKYDIFTFISKAFTYLYDITATVAKAFLHVYDINGSASSALTEQSGTVTLTALNSEICFVTKTDGPYNYAAYIFLTNMASGDKISIKVQVWDTVSGTWKSWDNEKVISYTDIKSDLAAFIPFLPARQYRICIKQTLGTPRSFNWLLYKSP
jgi:hypothetical protein